MRRVMIIVGGMITEHQMQTCDLTHRHGGNGWAVCQKLDKDYVRLTPVSGDDAMKRAFLAATSCLTVSPHQGHMKDVIGDIAALRGKIESGKLKVRDTRIVK